MNVRNNSKYDAISLLETTVYIGMFAVLFVTMVSFYFSIGRSNQRATIKVTNDRVAIFLNEHMDDLIDNADAFDEANSTYDTDLSTLRFTYGSGYLEYYVSSDILYVTDGTDTFPLTSPGLEVSKFRGDVSEDGDTSMYHIDIEVNFNNPDFESVEEVLELFYITS